MPHRHAKCALCFVALVEDWQGWVLQPVAFGSEYLSVDNFQTKLEEVLGGTPWGYLQAIGARTVCTLAQVFAWLPCPHINHQYVTVV